jgi:hypothetical protein
MGMLAIVAAILFGMAWIINAAGTVTNAWFSAWRTWNSARCCQGERSDAISKAR